MIGLRAGVDWIKAGLALSKAKKQFERDEKMGYDWTKSIKAGVTQILTLMLTAAITAVLGVLSDNEAIKGALVKADVNDAYAGALLLVVGGLARVLQNAWKHNKPSAGVPGSMILLVLLPSLSWAQEPPTDLPAPTPASVEVNLYAGAMQFAERGQPDKRDFVYRLTVNLPAPSGVTLFARADYTRTQDGGDLLDVKTFRSIEAFAGGRKDIAPNLSALAYSGVSWNRDSSFEPADPRLWTAAAGLRYSVPGRGYVLASAGHHGPVGGAAFLGSIVYEINPGASWFGDVAIPLDASRFAARPYTIKAGISARLKGWKF